MLKFLVLVSLLVFPLSGLAKEPPAAPTAGARADFLTRYSTIEGKIFQMANAMNEVQFNWSPAAGVRSLSAAFLHVTTTHYRLAEAMGAPIPKGIDLKKIEALTVKADVLKALEASYRHVHTAILKRTDADLDKPATIWGKPRTVRFAIILALAHSAEHLGQAIAYGRMQGVVPPWSKKAPAPKQ